MRTEDVRPLCGPMHNQGAATPPSRNASWQTGPNSPTGFPATRGHEILCRPPGHHKELFEAGRELWGGLGVPWQFIISLKNHFSVVVKKVRAAVLRANYLANGHAQRLILKLVDSEGR